MDDFLQLWENQWDAYPHWLVLSAVVLTAAIVLWLSAKLIAWIMKLVLVCAVIGVVVGVCWHFLGK